ncbi:MAG TPA: C40 family peptidase [Candidatus Woesebacteria bacterium]|nr:C40 family peptidase [Candidatus Woesebacteria bacterium]
MKDKRSLLNIYALECIKKPYKYGATLQQAPHFFDCSSLVQYLYKKIGIDLPKSTITQAHVGKKISIDKLQIGDLLFFHGTVGHFNTEFPEGIGHVVMYIGNGQAIHASGKKGMVIVEKLTTFTKRKDLVIIKRVLNRTNSKNMDMLTFFKLKMQNLYKRMIWR